MFFSGTNTHTHTQRTDVYSTHVLPHSAAGVESWGGGIVRRNRLELQNRWTEKEKEKAEREILAFLCPLFRRGMLLMFANANVSER